MRALALILIIGNLAFLGWATLIDVQPPQTQGVSDTLDDAKVKHLVLVSERDRGNKEKSPAETATSHDIAPMPATPSEAVGANAVSAPIATQSCISVGPFQDLTSAAQASAILKSAGHDSRQRSEQGQLWVGYWVNVPNFPNREDAERAVAKLKKNGIDDVYISLNQEESNIVSLGVFKEFERAQHLFTEAKALGFTPQISERTRPGSVYWVDLDLAAADSKLDLAALNAQPGKILRLEQRACPKAAH